MTQKNSPLAVEIFREFLSNVVSANEAAELDLPHVVVCTDPCSGMKTYAGPFPDAVSALTYTETCTSTDGPASDGLPLHYSVAALHPPGNPR